MCPGRVETPFVAARLKEYPDPAAAYREMSETQAIGRLADFDLMQVSGASERSGYLHQEGMILSPDGHCRPFDARAAGTRAGAGAGIVVL